MTVPWSRWVLTAASDCFVRQEKDRQHGNCTSNFKKRFMLSVHASKHYACYLLSKSTRNEVRYSKGKWRNCEPCLKVLLTNKKYQNEGFSDPISLWWISNFYEMSSHKMMPFRLWFRGAFVSDSGVCLFLIPGLFLQLATVARRSSQSNYSANRFNEQRHFP